MQDSPPSSPRLLVGISVFWLALSLLSDGLNTLVLPALLLRYSPPGQQATALGLLSFAGLAAGMLLMPFAGAASDRLRPRWGRRGFLALGTLLIVAGLALFGLARTALQLAAAYLWLNLAAAVAQSAQQGFIPDLVPPERRGTASGLKGLMDIGGAMLGFIVLGALLGNGQVGLVLGLMAGAVALGMALTLVLVGSRERNAALPETPAAPESPSRPASRAFAWLVLSRFLFLLGTYAVGRFLLYFTADRLGLAPNQAAEQAGTLLAGLSLVTVLAALPGGWAADRFGRLPLMLAGALVSAVGVLLLVWARSPGQILLFGSLMGLGSAAFAGANWAMTADLAPPRRAGRMMGLANFGTAGALAAAGLFGPLVDWGNRAGAGQGYSLLFAAAAAAFVLSALALRGVSVHLRVSAFRAGGALSGGNLAGANPAPLTKGITHDQE